MCELFKISVTYTILRLNLNFNLFYIFYFVRFKDINEKLLIRLYRYIYIFYIIIV